MAAVATASALVAACSSSAPTAPTIAPTTLSAFLAVSNQNPAVGSPVQVSVQVDRGSQVAPVGSYVLELRYDTLLLAFASQPALPSGFAFINISHDTIRAVGAAPNGFDEDRLLTIQFGVRAADALASLSVRITEINSTGFSDQRGALVIDRTLH